MFCLMHGTFLEKLGVKRFKSILILSFGFFSRSTKQTGQIKVHKFNVFLRYKLKQIFPLNDKIV